MSSENKMKPDLPKPDRISLAESLQSILNKYEKSPSIGELMEAVGDKGFGLLLVILSLPSALPIPALGYSTLFGICMAIIAVQIFIGRTQVQLPKRLKKIRIPLKLVKSITGFALHFLKRTEKLIKPRQRWIHSKLGHSVLSITIFVMALFMMFPIPGTNTLPAMAIFVIGISIAEEDGLIAILAVLLSILAAAFSGWLIYWFISEGPEKVEALTEGIKSWIKARFGADA
ncbi:MAG: hypothetical protein ACJAT5_000336 [Lentimonas sp.]|jgi:hypothetical protein